MSVFRSNIKSRLFASASFVGDGASILLSANSVPGSSPAGTDIGLLSVTGTGTWTFSLVASYDAGGRATVTGNVLECTSTAFDYSGQTSWPIRVKAVRTVPYAEVIQEFTLTVTAPGYVGNLPSTQSLTFGTLTLLGQGGHRLGYTGTGYLGIISEKNAANANSTHFAIDSRNSIVPRNGATTTFGNAPPTFSTGYTVTVAEYSDAGKTAATGRQSVATITMVPNECTVTAINSGTNVDTSTTNQLRTAMNTVAPGVTIRMRDGAIWNPNWEDWRVRRTASSPVTTAMAGAIAVLGADDSVTAGITDDKWIQIIPETQYGATITRLQLEGNNQKIQGFWFRNLAFDQLEDGVKTHTAILKIGTGSPTGEATHVRLSGNRFRSNLDTSVALAGTKVSTAIDSGAGTREVYIHDNYFDGVYDGVSIVGMQGVTSFNTVPTNAWIVGNVFANVWNDCRKLVCAAPTYSLWNFDFNKRYGTGGLHGDFEQRLFTGVIAGTYVWGCHVGNVSVRANGTATYLDGQGLFQTAPAATAVTFTGARVQGYLYVGTMGRGITLDKCVDPIIENNTLVRDTTAGITTPSNSSSAAIYVGSSTGGTIQYNVTSASPAVVFENGHTGAFNAYNVGGVDTAQTAAAYFGPAFGSAADTLTENMTAWAYKIGGTLDKAITNFPRHVGAVGVGIYDHLSRVALHPADIPWLNTAFRQSLAGDATWGGAVPDPQNGKNITSTVINNLDVYPVLSADGVYMHGKAAAVSGQAGNATVTNAGSNPLLAGHSYWNSAASPGYSRQLPPGTYDVRIALGQTSAGSESAVAVFEGLYENLGFGATLSTVRHWAASTEYVGSLALISTVDGSTWSKTSTTATSGTTQPSGAGPTFVDGGITWTRLPRTALLVLKATTTSAAHVIDQNNAVVLASDWASKTPVPLTVTGSPTYGSGLCLIRFGSAPFPYVRAVSFRVRAEPLAAARLVNDLGVEQGSTPTVYAGQPADHLGFKIVTTSGSSGVSNFSLSGDLAPYFTLTMRDAFVWLSHNGMRIPDELEGPGKSLIISQTDHIIDDEPKVTTFSCNVVSSQGRPTSGMLGNITTQNWLNRKTVMDKVDALWPGYTGQSFAQDLLATSVADFTTKLKGLTPDGTSWYRIRLAEGPFISSGSNSDDIAKDFGTGGLLIEPNTSVDPNVSMAFTGLRIHGLHMRNLLLACDFGNGTTGLYHWRFQDTGLTGINGGGRSNKVKINNCRVGYRHLPGALASEWQTRRAFPFTMTQGESIEVTDCQFYGTGTAHGYSGVRVVNLARNDYRSVPYDVHAINNAGDWTSTQGVFEDDNIYVNISNCTLRDEVDYSGYTQSGHLDWYQVRNWGQNTSFWYPNNVEDNLATPYDNGVAYTVGKRVIYSGSAYICTVATTAGTLPTNTSFWAYGGWRVGYRCLNMVGPVKAVYEVVSYTTGITAGGDGPQGTGQTVVDGGVTWKWLADYTTASDSYINIENNIINSSGSLANGPARQCFIDSNGGHDCGLFISYNNNLYGGTSSYGITDVSAGELHAEFNTYAAPSTSFSSSGIASAQFKKTLGDVRARHNYVRNGTVGLRTSIEDEKVLVWTSSAVSPNRPSDHFNGPVELDAANKWSYPTVNQTGTAAQFSESMRSILVAKVGTAGYNDGVIDDLQVILDTTDSVNFNLSGAYSSKIPDGADVTVTVPADLPDSIEFFVVESE